mmetsp:Transcript_3810/g.13379  ORF Transcript_3810/g.13379 Transcript_3810/m.13379 type:complete len:311 (-) Transcript_3810:666-1598(-)
MRSCFFSFVIAGRALATRTPRPFGLARAAFPALFCARSVALVSRPPTPCCAESAACCASHLVMSVHPSPSSLSTACGIGAPSCAMSRTTPASSSILPCSARSWSSCASWASENAALRPAAAASGAPRSPSNSPAARSAWPFLRKMDMVERYQRATGVTPLSFMSIVSMASLRSTSGPTTSSTSPPALTSASSSMAYVSALAGYGLRFTADSDASCASCPPVRSGADSMPSSTTLKWAMPMDGHTPTRSRKASRPPFQCSAAAVRTTSMASAALGLCPSSLTPPQNTFAPSCAYPLLSSAEASADHAAAAG